LFVKELAAHVGIPNHSNTSHFIGASRDNKLLFTFIEGGTLRDNMPALADFTVAIQVLRNVLNGLRHIHLQKWTHNDIKLDNIMFNGGNAILIDFGVACLVGSPVFGRDPRAAHEVEIDLPTTPRSDIYSVGMVMYDVYDAYVPTQSLLEREFPQ